MKTLLKLFFMNSYLASPLQQVPLHSRQTEAGQVSLGAGVTGVGNGQGRAQDGHGSGLSQWTLVSWSGGTREATADAEQLLGPAGD